jgi:ketosteroid isomerase-like protein
MNPTNKAILEEANAFISKGDYEQFLTYCTEDTEWTFVGEQILRGKKAVRKYMEKTYVEPPKFDVEHAIAEGDYVTVLGKISLKDQNGKSVEYDYCDVWTFRDGKMAGVKAFVIETR